MAHWVRCSPLGSDQQAYINLDTALLITSQDRGSNIVYAGDAGDALNNIRVIETPEEIFALPEVRYANRT